MIKEIKVTVTQACDRCGRSADQTAIGGEGGSHDAVGRALVHPAGWTRIDIEVSDGNVMNHERCYKTLCAICAHPVIEGMRALGFEVER